MEVAGCWRACLTAAPIGQLRLGTEGACQGGDLSGADGPPGLIVFG